ncbi:hypothetical protein [Nesterenkonia pannonica]|nr:hypothetical protein [Nesterenkonia pannonica]
MPGASMTRRSTPLTGSGVRSRTVPRPVMMPVNNYWAPFGVR